MSDEHHDSFSLTSYVGGSDHHAINHDQQGGGDQKEGGQKEKGGGLLSKMGWSLLGGGASLLWKKFGSPVLGKISAWAEKEFPETAEFLKGLKSRTVGLFKDVAADLEKAPGKIMGEVKAVGEDLKAIKDEIGGKISSVWKSGVSLLSRTKDGIVNAAEHPGTLLKEAEHIPGAETVMKAAEGTIGKTIAKAGLKTFLEDVPLLGAGVGTFFAIRRAMKGDWTGAAMEETAGVASSFPGVGTAVSTGLNVTLAARDIARGDGTTPATPNVTQTPGTQLPAAGTPTDLNAALAQVQQEAGGSTGSLAPVVAAGQNAVALQRAVTAPPTMAAAPRTDLPPIPGLSNHLAARPDISKGVHLPGHGQTQDNGVALMG